LFFFGILKLFIGFHVPFYTKPEKETGSKMSSLATFDPEDLRTQHQLSFNNIDKYFAAS
jgi:hypothetical protein